MSHECMSEWSSIPLIQRHWLQDALLGGFAESGAGLQGVSTKRPPSALRQHNLSRASTVRLSPSITCSDVMALHSLGMEPVRPVAVFVQLIASVDSPVSAAQLLGSVPLRSALASTACGAKRRPRGRVCARQARGHKARRRRGASASRALAGLAFQVLPRLVSDENWLQASGRLPLKPMSYMRRLAR
jgi:hypothetical protein